MIDFAKRFQKLDLGIHGVRLPSFKVDDNDKRKLGISDDSTNEKFLYILCKREFDLRKFNSEKYNKRFEHEFNTVKEKRIKWGYIPTLEHRRR